MRYFFIILWLLSIYLSDTIKYLNVHDKIITIDNIKIIKITDNDIYYIKSLGFLGEQTKKIKKDRIISYKASDYDDFKSNTISIDSVINNIYDKKGFYDLSVGINYIPTMPLRDSSLKILGLDATLKFGLSHRKKGNNFIRTSYLYLSSLNDLLNKKIRYTSPDTPATRISEISLGFGSSSYILTKNSNLLHYVKIQWGLRPLISVNAYPLYWPIIWSWNIGYGVIFNRKIKIELSGTLHNWSKWRKYNYINLNCSLSLNTLYENLLHSIVITDG